MHTNYYKRHTFVYHKLESSSVFHITQFLDNFKTYQPETFDFLALVVTLVFGSVFQPIVKWSHMNVQPSAATKQNVMMQKHPHCVYVCLCVSCKNSTLYNRSLIYYPFHPAMCSWIIFKFLFRILDSDQPSDAFSAHKGWTDILWVIKVSSAKCCSYFSTTQ